MKPLMTILLLMVISLNSKAQLYEITPNLKVIEHPQLINPEDYKMIQMMGTAIYSPNNIYYKDTSIPSNLDTIIRRDSTLGIVLFIDTTFVLRTAICLRVHSVLIVKYKPKWFYNADDLTEYLTLNDGRWLPDIDDNKWMEFIPAAQFQDFKVRPGVKNWEVVR